MSLHLNDRFKLGEWNFGFARKRAPTEVDGGAGQSPLAGEHGLHHRDLRGSLPFRTELS